MKKLTLLAAIAAATAASFANADTVLGVYAGYGSWDSSYDGKAGDPSITLKDLGVKDHKNKFFYVALEHPIPLVPNIRLSHTDISTKQTADISRTFTIDDVTYTQGDTVNSEFDLTHTDATLYYEILDNWVNLDVGLTVRQFDGFVYAASTTSPLIKTKEKVDEALPMLYGKAQFDLPLTGLSVGVEGNYVSYSGDKVTDYSAKVSYLFDSVLDVGLEAGYRKLSLTVDEDDLQAKVDIKGPYAAVIAHF
ncbi:MAG: TIGR04219 family outer membrane beta-barrel protein [Gammaproteobacteria bacterium]|nr:MAG: TIGR04219 family outer membrane beta-barrel protein [Gammaproteobacteria bacterium]